MKYVSHLQRQLIIAGALGILFIFAAFPSPRNPYAHFAGIYESDPAPAGKYAPTLGISLGPDGSATITQDSGTAETTFFGRWADNGSQITVTFDAVAGTPAEPPMVFESAHGGLQAVTWNHARWGKRTPPLARKSSGNWHDRGRWWSER